MNKEEIIISDRNQVLRRYVEYFDEHLNEDNNNLIYNEHKLQTEKPFVEKKTTYKN